MTQEFLTSVFGWMAVINIAVLCLSALLLMVMKDWVAGLHARLFGLEEARVRQAIYVWLGNYKILTLIFALVPYLALRIAG